MCTGMEETDIWPLFTDWS